MTLTNVGLVEHAKATLGTNYVFGMKNTIMTQANYTYLFNQYGSEYVWVSDADKIGTICVDCSGLISSYTGKTKNSTSYKNESTAYTIDTIDKAPIGSAVWRSGHIGIYIGDGEIIEARGSAFGTVQTKVSERDFTHWFKLVDIEYEEEYEVEDTTILIDGKEYELEAVMIENYTFVKFRDLEKVSGFSVGWDNDLKLASLTTK